MTASGSGLAAASNSQRKKMSSRPLTSCSLIPSSRLNGRCQSRSLMKPGDEHGRRRRRARGAGDVDQRGALDPVAVIGGDRVADGEARVVPDEGEAVVAERVHHRDELAGERARVVAAGGPVGEPAAALVDGDDREVPRQRRHDEPPRVPGLGPAVDEQQRRTVAADDGVQAHVADLDVPALERVGEAGGEIRRAADGAGAFRSVGGVHAANPPPNADPSRPVTPWSTPWS